MKTIAPGIRKYVGPKGTSFYAHAHDKNGKQISLGKHATEKEAAKARKRYEVQRDDGKAALHTRDTVTATWEKYDAHLEARVKAGELSPNSVKLMRQHFRVWLEPNMGITRIKDLRKGHVLDLIDLMRRSLRSSASQRSVLAVLRGLLDYAVNHEVVSHNVVRELVRPVQKANVRKAGALSREESERLVSSVTARWHLTVLLALKTGLRAGELLGARWQDIDFDARKIHVRGQLLRDGSWSDNTKTETSLRSVDLTDELVAELKRAKLASPAGCPWVFSEADGTPRRHGAFYRSVDRAATKAKVSITVTPHVLRHTFASTLMAKNVNVVKVAAQMGHKDPGITLKTYSHVIAEENDEQVREALA